MIAISARALAAVSWEDLVPLETRQSPYEAVMATAAFEAFSESSLSLISIPGGTGAPMKG
jgi:hypothetical protein